MFDDIIKSEENKIHYTKTSWSIEECKISFDESDENVKEIVSKLISTPDIKINIPRVKIKNNK